MRRDEAEARAEALQLFKQLYRQAKAKARQQEEAGDLAAALAVYDRLLPVVRQHSKIVAQRTQLVGLLHEHARLLLEANDLPAALAVYDALPEVYKTEFRQNRDDILERHRKRSTTQAHQQESQGDLFGALAVFDEIPPELSERDDVFEERGDIFEPLRKLAERQARELIRTGHVAAALTVYDRLPVEVRQHPRIVSKQAQLVHLLRNQARSLQEAGDLPAALALYDRLLAAFRVQPDFIRDRSHVLSLMRKRVKLEAQHLKQAGDLAGALAVYDRLAIEHHDSVIHYRRGRLLYSLGQLHAAEESLQKGLSADPSREEIWRALGRVIADLGQRRQLEAFIDEMISKLPPSFNVLKKAAELANIGQLYDLEDELFDKALTLAPSANASDIVRTAEALFEQGALGRVINLLGNEHVRRDADLGPQASDLSARAHAQLRLAGRPSSAGPVTDIERADTLVVRSILEQANKVPAAVPPARNGIVIIASSLGAGGTQKQVVELLRQLVANRDLIGQVILLLSNRSTQAPEDFHESRLRNLGVTVEFATDFNADPQGVLSVETAEKLSVLPPLVFDAVVSITSRLKLHAPKVVLNLTTLKALPAMLAASIAGIPSMVVSERNALRRPNELLKFAYRTGIAQNSVSLVTNSATTSRQFAKWLDVPAERIGAIHNGLDVDELRAQRDPAAGAAYRRSFGIADGARIVGAVFQARRTKRAQLWIEAASVIAKRAPDVEFIVVGEKLDRPDLSNLIVHHGLESRFHRPGLQRDVATWMGLMDVFLLTSQFEGTPNALLEAQALGRPVVATDVGGVSESFLPGETGLLLPTHPTPEEIADAVLRVLDDPGFAARADEMAPKFIRERFSAERMATEFIDLCFEERGRKQRGQKRGGEPASASYPPPDQSLSFRSPPS